MTVYIYNHLLSVRGDPGNFLVRYHRPPIPMDSDCNSQKLSKATKEFKQSLEQLILQSFADGVPIEDSWDIIVPLGDAPNWTVAIEKWYSEEGSSYQPNLLRE